MVVEILNDNADWRISLPDEQVYFQRDLEARHYADNTVAKRWTWHDGMWRACAPDGGYESWMVVLQDCYIYHWKLYSVPATKES